LVTGQVDLKTELFFEKLTEAFRDIEHDILFHKTSRSNGAYFGTTVARVDYDGSKPLLLSAHACHRCCEYDDRGNRGPR
jgi:hypothetical protein